MPPPAPTDHLAYRLRVIDRPFAVTQLTPNESIPAGHLAKLTEAGLPGRFMSITRTVEEVSIVYEVDENEENAAWRCIKIAGPMDFGMCVLQP